MANSGIYLKQEIFANKYFSQNIDFNFDMEKFTIESQFFKIKINLKTNNITIKDNKLLLALDENYNINLENLNSLESAEDLTHKLQDRKIIFHVLNHSCNLLFNYVSNIHNNLEIQQKNVLDTNENGELNNYFFNFFNKHHDEQKIEQQKINNSMGNYLYFNSNGHMLNLNSNEKKINFNNIDNVLSIIKVLNVLDNVFKFNEINSNYLLDDNYYNYMCAYNTEINNFLKMIIDVVTPSNDYKLFRYGQLNLINHFQTRHNYWDMIINLVMDCINSKKNNQIFKPRPEYIHDFQLLEKLMGKILITNFDINQSSVKYNNDYKNKQKYVSLFNTLFNNYTALLTSFISQDNITRYGGLNEDSINIYSNLEYYLYTNITLVYHVLETTLNNFNLFSFNTLDSKSLLKKLNTKNESTKNELKNLESINIYEVNTNDIELENKFKTNSNTCSDLLINGFHGSYITNWYSILFNGLYVPDNKNKLMANANAYGSGIYLSNTLNYSISYTRCGSGNGRYLNLTNDNSQKCIIGIFQVYDGLTKYIKTSNIYVVPQSDKVFLKYLIYGNYSDIHKNINVLNKYFMTSFKSIKNEQTRLVKQSSNKRIMGEIKKLTRGSGIYDKSSGMIYIFEIKNEANMNILTIQLPKENFYDDDKPFEKQAPIYKDMIKFDIENVEFEIRLKEDYPFSPPFIRIVKPRFQYMTGHITLGGSICMELLTNQNWIPSFNIEKVMLMISQNIMVGEARLDAKNYYKSYGYEESVSAFKRMLTNHPEWTRPKK
jgi:hypothetical protein